METKVEMTLDRYGDVKEDHGLASLDIRRRMREEFEIEIATNYV